MRLEGSGQRLEVNIFGTKKRKKNTCPQNNALGYAGTSRMAPALPFRRPPHPSSPGPGPAPRPRPTAPHTLRHFAGAVQQRHDARSLLHDHGLGLAENPALLCDLLHFLCVLLVEATGHVPCQLDVLGLGTQRGNGAIKAERLWHFRACKRVCVLRRECTRGWGGWLPTRGVGGEEGVLREIARDGLPNKRGKSILLC